MFSIKNKYNKILLISVVILTIFGIIMIYSASHIWALYKFNNALKYAIFQLLFAGLGFVLMKINNINLFNLINTCFNSRTWCCKKWIKKLV